MTRHTDFACRMMRGERERQEDASLFSKIHGKNGNSTGLLVLVADGMGGHTAGERASKLAIKTFVKQFKSGGKTLRNRLNQSMTAANDALARESGRNPELDGMGTTLLAVAVMGNRIQWISVGDSMLYLLRDGALKRLNDDHSFRPFLREMVENGELSEEKAAIHPFRNLLRSALSGTKIELTDSPERPLDLRDGDLIIAATDGLQTLPDEEITSVLNVVANRNARTQAEALLRAVRKRKNKKQDNTTVAIVRVLR